MLQRSQTEGSTGLWRVKVSCVLLLTLAAAPVGARKGGARAAELGLTHSRKPTGSQEARNPLKQVKITDEASVYS